jgi:hypothetical protein
MSEYLELLTVLAILATIAGFAASILMGFLRMGWVLAPYIVMAAIVYYAIQFI